MKKNIPYSFFKSTQLVIWILALLCIAGTWTSFMLGNLSSMAFGLVTDILLALTLITFSVLMIICGRPDFQNKAWLVILVTLIHIAFFVVIAIIAALNKEEIYDPAKFGPEWVYPTTHTVILVTIAIIGLYLWIRNRFSFKSFAEKDAIAAFGKPIKEEPNSPDKPSSPISELEAPEEPKPARDEKTGIVTL